MTESSTPAAAAVPAQALPALPDRLSSDPRSPHFEEYCISEGWIKVPAGKAKDRKGQPMKITLKGTVEAMYG